MKRNAPFIVVVTLALLLSGCLNITGGYGSIAVDSEPPGARIFLDGKDTGKVTPAELKNVPVGKHEVTLEAEGYESQTKSVAVTRNKTVPLVFELEKVEDPNPDPDPDPEPEPEPDPNHARVDGYVSENLGGRRLPGATVKAYEAGTQIEVASTVTDEQGYYKLHIPAGTYDIVSDKAAHAQAKRQSLVVGVADEARVNLISKKIDDPAKGAAAPTIHVSLLTIENGEEVAIPFEPGTVIEQGVLEIGIIEIEAEYDVFRTQVWIGHRDITPNWSASLLTDSLVFGLWDGFDAPGDTELVIAAYDWQNNWTELRIPFTYAVGEPKVELLPVDLLDLTAVTYGHDLKLFRARRADVYDQLGLPGNPDLYELSDGTVIDLSRFDKDVTMYVLVDWSPVPGAVGYEIERASHRNGPWQRIALVGPSFQKPYIDLGPELAPGKAVWYRVRAVGPNGEKGGWSAPLSVTPLDRFEIRLTEPADDATNVSLTPTFRWTYTDVGADQYTFDIFVAGVTGMPGGVVDYYAWYYEDLENVTEVEYNFDGSGLDLLPSKTYQWNVIEGEAVAFYRPNSRAIAFPWTGPAEDEGYAGAANGAFLFTTAIAD